MPIPNVTPECKADGVRLVRSLEHAGTVDERVLGRIGQDVEDRLGRGTDQTLDREHVVLHLSFLITLRTMQDLHRSAPVPGHLRPAENHLQHDVRSGQDTYRKEGSETEALDQGFGMRGHRAFRCFPSSFLRGRARVHHHPTTSNDRGIQMSRSNGTVRGLTALGALLLTGAALASCSSGGSSTAVLLVGTYNGKAGQYTSIQSAVNAARPATTSWWPPATTTRTTTPT